MGHQTLTRMAVTDSVYADNTEDLIASLDQGHPSESQSADSTDTLRSLISAAAPMSPTRHQDTHRPPATLDAIKVIVCNNFRMTVYDSLRAMVMRGGLREDDRIAESQLAEQLGVSRTPVREALQRLESDGLVNAQGRGVRLRMLSTNELTQVYVARAGLEGWAAFLAAQRVASGEVAPARLASLETLAAETHELTVSGELTRAVEANRALHEAVAAIADNTVVSAALERWWDQIIISTRHSLQAPERAQTVHAEHTAILSALRNGDAPAARAAVEAHALGTRDAVNETRTKLRST
ncbi:hypothetical protein AUL38_05355 [Leucobacter sp. G161]|nr:hypothetical protein AUL38_05355 [Leucobacter sp. G161]